MHQGLRNLYCKKEIKQVEDIKNVKVRVQATQTEDTLFPAYGAQIVHMPFGEVYTSLQTGVVNAPRTATTSTANKHYEVAPVMSVTEHEANNYCSASATRPGTASAPSRRSGSSRPPTT